MKTTLTTLSIAMTLSFSGYAHAQILRLPVSHGSIWATATPRPTPTPQSSSSGDAFQVRYAANLDKGDSVVNITNAGTQGGSDPAGNICANVYVFSPDEQLISCCACLVTPDGLVSLSANSDLVSNLLTPDTPTSIVVKLLASKPTGASNRSCDPSSPTAATLASGMRAWGTTLHAAPTPTMYSVTETEFSPATLSASELTQLTSFCGFIRSNGSGFGQCRSCRAGGQ
jgi:hypothetical protein